MKSLSLFGYCIIGVVALTTFVVAADTTPPPPAGIDDELSLSTTPPPINISIDDLDADGSGDVPSLTVPQKSKQQQIQKHVQETGPDDVGDGHGAESGKPLKTHKPTAGATRTAQKKKKSVQAKHMVCSVVVGSLICYSVDQDEIAFDPSECVVAPIPDNADGKNYTVCSRSLI